MTRLQGEEFKNMRPKLRMLGYVVSSNGHIKAIMKLKTDRHSHIGGKTKRMYSHWLNPQEIERFKQSTYFKLNPPIPEEVLYKRRLMRKNKEEE